MARTIVFLAMSLVIFVAAIGTGWMYGEVSTTREKLNAAVLDRIARDQVKKAAFAQPANDHNTKRASELAFKTLNEELTKARHRNESVLRKFEAAQIELVEERRARDAAARNLETLKTKLVKERTAKITAERALTEVNTALTKQREETEVAKRKIKVIAAELAVERNASPNNQRTLKTIESEPPEQSETKETEEHRLKPAKAELTATVSKEVAEPSILKPSAVKKPVPEKPRARQPRSTVHIVQLELKRVGCYHGKVDGVWDEDSRHALWKFIRHAKRKFPSPIPPKTAIKALRAASSGACP